MVNPNSQTHNWQNRVGMIIEKEYSLYDAEYFKNILQLEVKRSERSKRPFILMLIDISLLLQFDEAVHTVRKVINDVSSVTRETDIKGWFASRKVLGVIFLEYDHMSSDVIIKKINDALQELLNPFERSLVTVNAIRFPEDISENGEFDINKWVKVYNDATYMRSVRKVPALCKRCIDVVGSLFLFVIFSPFFLIVPVLIKYSSKGTIFFRQERVGENGKRFILLKFRTMEENNNDSIHKDFMRNFIHTSANTNIDGADRVYKITDDPRVTRIGKWLRKTSLDEIPQLINVLLGNMSLVGPRPAIPYEVEEYDYWHKRRIIGVKPGITGFWQVNGRSRTDFNNMVRMDIQYIRKWTPLMDVFLLLKTPLALLTAKGAY